MLLGAAHITIFQTQGSHKFKHKERTGGCTIYNMALFRIKAAQPELSELLLHPSPCDFKQIMSSKSINYIADLPDCETV